jgi:phosphoribosyl 1,2-cyclic phosphate phosphodiesterase
LGYRFGGLAYSADVNDLNDRAFEVLQGVDTWIVDALRYHAHPTHANVETALRWIERVNPRRAVLTNFNIEIDYARLSAELPDGVEAAYDGMVVTAPASISAP